MENDMSYNVAFCCDDNYVVPACIALESMLKNNINISKDMIFYTFSDRLCEESKIKLQKIVEAYNSQLHFVDFPADLISIINNIPIYVNHITSVSFYRLFLPYVINTVDICLYVDCDILVRGSVLPLFEMNTKDCCIMGAYDDSAEYYAKRLGVSTYCNTGVLLMNFKEIRKHYPLESFISLLSEALANNVFLMGDQDIINLLFKDSLSIFPNEYNYQKHLKKIKTMLFHRKSIKNAVIAHFITHDKAWNPTHFYPYTFEYYKYLKKYILKKDKLLYWMGKPLGVVLHSIEYMYYDVRRLKNKIIHKNA